MNPPEMVVAIIAILAIASVIRAKHRARALDDPDQRPQADPDADRLREEVRTLKERVAVLERIATDNRHAADLDREIEKLRLRDQ